MMPRLSCLVNSRALARAVLVVLLPVYDIGEMTMSDESGRSGQEILSVLRTSTSTQA